MVAAPHERASLPPMPAACGTDALPRAPADPAVRPASVVETKEALDRRLATEAAALEQRLWSRILVLGCVPATGLGLGLGLFLFLPADFRRDSPAGRANLVAPVLAPQPEPLAVQERPAAPVARPLDRGDDAPLELPGRLVVAPAAFTADPLPSLSQAHARDTAQPRPPPSTALREMLAEIRKRLTPGTVPASTSAREPAVP
jgi:hypothetical protein